MSVCDARGASVAARRFPLDRSTPAALLRAIAALLRGRGGWSRIRVIDVIPGPGTFSRVRFGVVTANALAWAFGVPLTVRGRRVRLARPEYGKPPHITPPNAT